MKAVTIRRKTRDCQQKLEDALTKGLNQEKEIKIVYRTGGDKRTSGDKPYTVNHNGRIWFYSEWNAFGLNPDENTRNNIVVQINSLPDGKGGMFAYQDDSLFLLHTGNLGGGVKGRTKERFLEWYSRYAPIRDVEIDKGQVSKGILVGDISDNVNFLGDLGKFIENVRVFKQLTSNQTIGSKTADLLSSLRATKKKADRPGKRRASISTYERDPRIAELVKLEAKGKCDLCKKKGPFMDKVNGFWFLETHHVKWLSKGGKDSIDNTVALCPNCHRKMHHVNDGDDMDELKEIAKERTKLIQAKFSVDR